MDSTFHVPEMFVLTTEPSVTIDALNTLDQIVNFDINSTFHVPEMFVLTTEPSVAVDALNSIAFLTLPDCKNSLLLLSAKEFIRSSSICIYLHDCVIRISNQLLKQIAGPCRYTV